MVSPNTDSGFVSVVDDEFLELLDSLDERFDRVEEKVIELKRSV